MTHWTNLTFFNVQQESDSAIYFLRHGQSEFNAVFDGTKDPVIPDAPLTELGKSQALEARGAVKELGIERIITSPLTRALETATILSKNEIEIDVWDCHRELLNYSCDIGSPPEKLKAKFPNLKFDHLQNTWWYEQSINFPKIVKEPKSLIENRLRKFMLQISYLPNKNTLIVGHGNTYKEIIGFMLSNCQLYGYR